MNLKSSINNKHENSGGQNTFLTSSYTANASYSNLKVSHDSCAHSPKVTFFEKHPRNSSRARLIMSDTVVENDDNDTKLYNYNIIYGVARDSVASYGQNRNIEWSRASLAPERRRWTQKMYKIYLMSLINEKTRFFTS